MLILESTIDGHTIQVEPGDTHINLPELHYPIASLCWDGVWKADGHYHAVYLTNNEFAIEVIIPDADWLDADLLARIETPPFSITPGAYPFGHLFTRHSR